MNNKEKITIRNIIAIVILLGPIIDVCTGLSLHLFNWNLTIGIIFRMIFLIFICGVVLFYFKKKNVLIPYLLIALYGAFYLLGVFLYKNSVGLFSEIQGLLKVFYFPIIWISFYEMREDINISNLTLFTTLFLYLILIFIPLTLNIGFETYKITKEGTLGFYNSANEISGIISILTPILFIILKKAKSILSRIIFIIIYLIVILMIGTKTPLLSLGITLFFYLIYVWKEWIVKKAYKKIAISLVIVVISSITLAIIIPKTNFYKNIKTHLDFLQVEKVKDVFQNKKLIDHFIFSQRLTFLKNKSSIYKETNLYQKLFGIGYLKDGKEIKMIEMDYFDIFYSHGLFGFILFMGLTLIPLYKVLRNRKKGDYERYMFTISFLLIIILSSVTGHIVTSPSVSILCAIILLSFRKKEIKELVVLVKDQNIKKQLLTINNNNYRITLLEENKQTKLKALIEKILYYDTFDLSICDDNCSKNEINRIKSLSINNAIIIQKKDSLEKDISNFKYILIKTKSIKKMKKNNNIIDIQSKRIDEVINNIL